MKTYASLFSGFGGADLGAKAAGLQLAWGVEYDAKIAEVANYNLGQHIKVANLLDCDPMGFERVDVLHASPPCPSFSAAKTNGMETQLDIALAGKITEFIKVIQPEIFTLENVYAYRNSKSWRKIENTLYELGYWLHFSQVNAADYGVAQTRVRMIVRAIRGGFVPYLPPAERWFSWYDAIKDLIPSLKKTRFAEWQTNFVNQATGLYPIFMITGQNVRNSLGYRLGNQPAFTVTASQKANTRFSVDGEVYSMNPRCFARIQSFPDAYSLPENNILACRGIGNAVAPLMYQKVINGLVNA